MRQCRKRPSVAWRTGLAAAAWTIHRPSLTPLLVLHVQIARRTDNEETKSARFCRDGWLKEEGWYTFYHCS